ncbi:MAG: hypothetical protein JOZ62_14890 [Acidobacteriaceae bacterium]|nr:hypothetical protein [Acidobacteriaceae bacterium]
MPRPQENCSSDYQNSGHAGDRPAAKKLSFATRRFRLRCFDWLRFPFEIGAVGPRRQLDSDPMMRAVLREVMLSELLSYFIRRDANNCVLAGIEILRKLKQLHPDRALFKSAVRPAKRVLDDVLEELSASLAGPKRGALEQTVQFRPHSLLA